MYTPTMWANPNKLKDIQAKRETEHLDDTQIKKYVKKRNNQRASFFEALFKPFALVRLLKISNKSYSYK